MVPLPEEAKKIFPGRAFAAAISCATLFTPSDGLTTRDARHGGGERDSCKILLLDHGTFPCSAGLTVLELPSMNSV